MESKWTTVESKKNTYKPPHIKQAPSSTTTPFSNHTNTTNTFNQTRNNNSPKSSSPYPNNSHNKPRGGTNNTNNTNGNRGGNGRKKPNRPVVEYVSQEEKDKFTALKLEIPHIVMPGTMRLLRCELNVVGLETKFLSDDWIEYQREGWEFVRVVKPDDDLSEIPTDTDTIKYEMQELENGWGDLILFKLDTIAHPL